MSELAIHIFKNIYLKPRFIFLYSQLIGDEIILSHIASILSLAYRTKSVKWIKSIITTESYCFLCFFLNPTLNLEPAIEV